MRTGSYIGIRKLYIPNMDQSDNYIDVKGRVVVKATHVTHIIQSIKKIITNNS